MKSLATFAVLLLAGTAWSDPVSLEAALTALKEAEAKKDAVEVKKLAAETSALARAVIATPKPEAAAEKDPWAESIAHAKDVDLYTEYALYSIAIQSEPAVTVDLLATLEQQNPKSKYLDAGYPSYFVALQKTGAAAKIIPVAEKALANLPENEDLLLVLADNAITKKQNDRALSYAERLITVLGKHSAPAGMSAADWQKKRNAALGRGHWIAGIVHSDKTQWYEADKDLRASLPLIKENQAMLASALFYLGVANYQLGSAVRDKAQLLEAVKFSDQAAAIKGPLSEQAWRNSQLIKTAVDRMR